MKKLIMVSSLLMIVNLVFSKSKMNLKGPAAKNAKPWNKEYVESCRHEGLSDPSDASILFLIECKDGTKGCLSSAYGISADTDLIEFVLSLEKRKD